MSTWFFPDNVLRLGNPPRWETMSPSSRLDMKNLTRLDEFRTTGLADSMRIARRSLKHSSSASMMIIVTRYKAASCNIRFLALPISRIPDALPCYPSLIYSQPQQEEELMIEIG